MRNWREFSKYERKYFYLSLLRLLPGFGIIIGIVLMYHAIFSIKSSLLILAIIVGISINCTFVIFNFYELKQEQMYGIEAGNFMATMAQHDLDVIVSKLEKFNKINGEYPVTLKRLQNEFPGLSIEDPLLTRNASAHKFLEYYYQKKDSSYVLFSSGIDAIPNTNDDIFPRKSLGSNFRGK
jgi:hypothetical protein